MKKLAAIERAKRIATTPDAHMSKEKRIEHSKELYKLFRNYNLNWEDLR